MDQLRFHCCGRLLAGHRGARELRDHLLSRFGGHIFDIRQRCLSGASNFGLGRADLLVELGVAAFTWLSLARAEASLAACVTLSASARLVIDRAR
jgi:hypothetical protein